MLSTSLVLSIYLPPDLCDPHSFSPFHSPGALLQEAHLPVRQQSWDVLVDVSRVSLSPGQPAATEPRFLPPPLPYPQEANLWHLCKAGLPLLLGASTQQRSLNKGCISRVPILPTVLTYRSLTSMETKGWFSGGSGCLWASGWGFSFPGRWEEWGSRCWDSVLKDSCGGSASDREHCSHAAVHNGATTATAKLIIEVLIA